jgi:hypothetical protein
MVATVLAYNFSSSAAGAPADDVAGKANSIATIAITESFDLTLFNCSTISRSSDERPSAEPVLDDGEASFDGPVDQLQWKLTDQVMRQS